MDVDRWTALVVMLGAWWGCGGQQSGPAGPESVAAGEALLCEPGDLATCQTKCDEGQASYCTGAGLLHEKGQGTARNGEEAARLYRVACDAEHAAGCNHYGRMMRDGLGGVEQDESYAATFFETACQGGVIDGCMNLAAMHVEARRVGRDYPAILRLYGQACDADHALACLKLGEMRRDGTGTKRDHPQAVKLFDKACELGHAMGCFELGGQYEHGWGMAEDKKRGVELYRQACEAGAPKGCFYVGYAHLSGRGADKDPAKAFPLLRDSCGAGIVPACSNLGTMYRDGLGVPQDAGKAAELLQQGCDGGHKKACEWVEELEAAP